MRHKQHPQPRIPDSVCVCVWRGQEPRPEAKKSCTNTVVVFPWLASLWFGCAVLSRAISALFPTPSCTVAAKGNERQHGTNAWD